MKAFGRFCLLLLVATGANADVHRWTDPQGQVHFGDRPPADAATTVVDVRINTYESPSIEGLAAVVDSSDKVILYSTSWCGVCRRAREYFSAHKVAYEEYDVEHSKKGKRDFKRLGGRSVPVILVGKKRLNGFSKASFERLYDPS